MVFRDKSPAATSHLQIVPRKHIDNLSALSRSEADHALGEGRGTVAGAAAACGCCKKGVTEAVQLNAAAGGLDDVQLGLRRLQWGP